MTPAARVQAAILCLDRIISGAPAEQVLTGWARANRFAGSKDRAAIRDHVYGALRRRRSSGWLGGDDTGRAVMIGALLQDGANIHDLFTGEGYAPAEIGPGEGGGSLDLLAAAPDAVRLDMPDWLWAMLERDHGPEAGRIAGALRDRAAVWLRVNLARGSRAAAAAALQDEGIGTRPHPDVSTALCVTSGAGGVQRSRAYLSGLVELQDAASQAAVLRLPLAGAERILDYCAGGGGKGLAIAALTGGSVAAHDGDPRRMADLPERARRAGARITVELRPAVGAYDLVLVDAPCSGSGTWRRTPDAKWRLTPDRLAELTALQAQILRKAADYVAPGGILAYATCSILAVENGQQARGLRGWDLGSEMELAPSTSGDGFYLALLRRR